MIQDAQIETIVKKAVWKFIIFMNEEWKRQKRTMRAEKIKSRKKEE